MERKEDDERLISGIEPNGPGRKGKERNKKFAIRSEGGEREREREGERERERESKANRHAGRHTHKPDAVIGVALGFFTSQKNRGK